MRPVLPALDQVRTRPLGVVPFTTFNVELLSLDGPRRHRDGPTRRNPCWTPPAAPGEKDSHLNTHYSPGGNGTGRPRPAPVVSIVYMQGSQTQLDAPRQYPVSLKLLFVNKQRVLRGSAENAPAPICFHRFAPSPEAS